MELRHDSRVKEFCRSTEPGEIKMSSEQQPRKIDGCPWSAHRSQLCFLNKLKVSSSVTAWNDRGWGISAEPWLSQKTNNSYCSVLGPVHLPKLTHKPETHCSAKGNISTRKHFLLTNKASALLACYAFLGNKIVFCRFVCRDNRCERLQDQALDQIYVFNTHCLSIYKHQVIIPGCPRQSGIKTALNSECFFLGNLRKKLPWILQQIIKIIKGSGPEEQHPAICSPGSHFNREKHCHLSSCHEEKDGISKAFTPLSLGQRGIITKCL